MKRTAATFAVAMALFLSAIAFSQRPPDETSRVALDFTGIDTVEVASKDNFSLTFADGQAHEVRVDSPSVHEDIRDVQVSRRGSTLIIATRALPEPTEENPTVRYRELKVSLPTRVRHLILRGSEIEVKTPMPSLEVRSSGPVFLQGDIQQLRVIDTREPAGCKGKCANMITIRSGTIQALTVATRDGSVALEQAGTIASATLALGPDATFSLGNTRRLNTVHLVDFDPLTGDAPVQVAPAEKTD